MGDDRNPDYLHSGPCCAIQGPHYSNVPEGGLVTTPIATPDHDPRVYLDRAAAAIEMVAKGFPEGLQTATLWAQMATASAMLMPTPEEVIATYEETRAEVLDEVQGDLVKRAHRAKRILEDAVRDGSRRHPAIHAALEALGDLDG